MHSTLTPIGIDDVAVRMEKNMIKVDLLQGQRCKMAFIQPKGLRSLNESKPNLSHSQLISEYHRYENKN